MFAFLFLFTLVLLAGLLVLSVILRRMNMASPIFSEPARIPANMGWSLLLAAAALNIFTYRVGFGIGYGVFGVCTIAAIFLLFPPEKRSSEAWFLAIVGGIACLLFGFRGNEFVQAVNVVTALLCAGALALLRSIETLRWHGLWFLKMKAGFLARLLHRPFPFGPSLRTARTASGSFLLTILKTLAFTLIVLLFFSWILSSADPVFDNLIRVVRDQAVGRAVLSGILILLLLACLTVTVPVRWQERVPQLRALSFMEMFVPALSLAILFGLFLGVQATYLFATHADFQALGITYSDYVRRGFVELLIASFTGSLLSYALILKQHALEEKRSILKLQWVNGVLLVELLLLLASAAKRDWMYVEIYGLTRVRMIGALFLLWLCGIIVLILALNFLRTMTERRFLTAAAVISTLVVAVLNAANIDRVIALRLPPRGERPDIVYMSRLSTDAVDGWFAAVTEGYVRYESLRQKTHFSKEEKVHLADVKIAMELLGERFRELSEPRPWQEWNWSRSNAIRSAREHSLTSRLSMSECIKQGIRQLQFFTKTDLLAEEERRVHDYRSPFMFSPYTYLPESLESIALQFSSSSLPSAPPSCKGSSWGA